MTEYHSRSPEQLGNPLNVRTQLIAKRETQDKQVDIFILRLTHAPQVLMANAQPASEVHELRRESARERTNAGHCGPDLFFALWDFTDAARQCWLD